MRLTGYGSVMAERLTGYIFTNQESPNKFYCIFVCIESLDCMFVRIAGKYT